MLRGFGPRSPVSSFAHGIDRRLKKYLVELFHWMSKTCSNMRSLIFATKLESEAIQPAQKRKFANKSEINYLRKDITLRGDPAVKPSSISFSVKSKFSGLRR